MRQAVRLDTRILDKMISEKPDEAHEIVYQYAEQVEAQAKANIQAQDLIDTGALMNGIHVRPVNPLHAQVADRVEYGIHWELGFHQMVFGRFQLIRVSQRPFLVPAVEKYRRSWNERWRRYMKP
jgi:hypothetical protein